MSSRGGHGGSDGGYLDMVPPHLDANGPRMLIDESTKYYSAEEIWMFDLAIDVAPGPSSSASFVS
jgi:hypothetical protein